MANLLATGAGATEGLDNALHRMLLEQELQQRQDALKETTRHNQAGEADARRGQDFLQQGRVDANNEKLADNTRQGSQTEPIGADVSPEDYAKRMAAGVPAGQYSKIPGLKVQQFAGGSELPDVTPRINGLRSVTPDTTAFAKSSTDATSPLNAPDTIKNRGTQAQIQAVNNEDDKLGKGAPATSDQLKTQKITDAGLATALGKKVGDPIDVMFDPKSQTFTYRGKDVTKGVDHYEKPAAPDRTIIWTDEGARRRGDVNDDLAHGKTVNPQDPATVRTRQNLAGHVSEGIDQAMQSLDEAEKAGVLGPLSGRTYGEFLAGKVGSTGDEKTDELLGRLRMDLQNSATGFSALHGRGGANAGMARDIEKKMDSTYMSHALIAGGLKSMKGWTDRYATKKTGTTQAGGDGNDADPLGLLK